MPVYGYRVFVVQVYPGRKHAPVGFHECSGTHYQDVAAGLLQGMRGETLVEQPRRTAADGTPGPDMVIDLDLAESTGTEDQASSENPYAGRKGLYVDIVAVDEETVYGEMLVGTFGDHDAALAAPRLVEVDQTAERDAEDPADVPHVDLKGTAPARRYRFVLNTPGEGALGLLIVEDISRGCPVDLLIRWLNRRSQDAASAAVAAMPVPPRPRDRPSWWRLQHLPAVDEDHFRAMIAQGHLERVELVQHSVTSGGNRAAVGLRLTAPHPEGNVLEGLLGLVDRWVRDKQQQRVDAHAGTQPQKPRRMTRDERLVERDRQREQRAQSDAEAARAVAAILGEKISEIGFDDGWLILDDGGRTKRISPSRISELFTYELDRRRRPSNVAFYAAARTKALSLQVPLQLHLDWPESIYTGEQTSGEPGPRQPTAAPAGTLEGAR